MLADRLQSTSCEFVWTQRTQTARHIYAMAHGTGACNSSDAEQGPDSLPSTKRAVSSCSSNVTIFVRQSAIARSKRYACHGPCDFDF